MTEEQWREIDEAVEKAQDYDSGDELDDERLPLFYVRPRFERTQGVFVPPPTRQHLRAALWTITCFRHVDDSGRIL